MQFMMKNNTEAVIFESPDGGKTIYSRKYGSLERTLVTKDSSKHYTKKLDEWKNILTAAEKNSELRNALEKAEMIYALSKEEKS